MKQNGTDKVRFMTHKICDTPFINIDERSIYYE